ncbi:two-component regulator propeller domain-containing protein [uncultured Draconibacterium sp.]|uniref:two-component regulator propeller domain-containing protein n=1 Tax=uncultured Draconibacterium sp. TaxID=1573823 RepID=UPI0032615E24
MRRKLYTVFLFLSLSCVYAVNAVNPDNTVHFRNLNDEYGLSIRGTNSVCGDYNGFIWISSKMEIMRYAANDVRTYQLPYESLNVITTRLTFYDGSLFAYTNNGQIFYYDELKDRFVLWVNLAKDLRYANLTVSKVLVDTQQRLWISSTVGLFCFDKQNGLKSMAPNGYIYHMDWYEKDKLLLAVNSGELLLFDVADNSTELYYTFTDEWYKSLCRIHVDKKYGMVWIGTMEYGLFALTTGADKELIELEEVPNQPVLALQSYLDSTLLVGIDGQGVWQINKNNLGLLSVMKEDADNPNSLKGNGVYDIYTAPDNRVWVCTYSGGVSYFDKKDPGITKLSHEINNPNSLINNDVNSVLEDANGNLWFATNDGISFFNRKANRWNSYFHQLNEGSQVFLDLLEDSKGRIWASTYSSGIYILDKNSGRLLKRLSQEHTQGDFSGDFVFELFEDEDHNVWISGVRGNLICYNVETDTYKNYDRLAAFVTKNYGRNNLLLGTNSELILFNKNTGEAEVLLDGVSFNDFYVDNEKVWMATTGNGLLLFDINTKAIKNFTTASGLLSNYVNSLKYHDQSLWIGTEQGLNKLNLKDTIIQSYNSLLNLGEVAFNPRSHCTLKNGKLLMGTNKGALIFDPETLSIKSEAGSIFIQDISVSGRSIREIKELEPQVPIDKLEHLTLKYYQNTISLELIPIGLITSGAKFSWLLDGIDEHWSTPVNSKFLSYSNIPAGNYTLRVKMFDGANSNVIASRVIQLTMVPPFWATWWFRLLVVSFVVGITLFIMFYYIDHIKKLHSDEKIRFFANTAHDIRTSLTLINGPIEELNKESGLSGKGHHYLHLATEQTQRLLKVVTQLMDFQKADIGKEKLALEKVDIVKMIADRVMMFESYASNNAVDLSFNSNLNEYYTRIDENLIEKVVDNLISNAIKYSHPNTTVQVQLQCTATKWLFEVKDQGIGISKKAQRQLFKEYYRAENVVNSKIVGSGIGLLLVKNYVNLHGGKITCSSQLNVGATFQVVIPTVNADGEAKEITAEGKSISTSQQKQETKLPGVEIAGESGKAKMKVLIAEDNEYLRDFLQLSMSDQFEILLTKNGAEAWKTIQNMMPDLVVSDIIMPEMDGFELCKKIKTTYETSHLPVILLTSLSGKSEQIHGFGYGADDYLTKPFDVSLLQQRIKTLIKNREIIREKALKLIRREDDGEAALLENELNDKFLKRMIEVVNENLSNTQFSKSDFAAEMNVSSSLLYKKTKSLTNQSPTDFIKTIRLDQAIKLIQSKKYTITEVSELCGFASVGYFSTVFRKHFGKSPSQILD